jgi:hypothetical protein
MAGVGGCGGRAVHASACEAGGGVTSDATTRSWLVGSGPRRRGRTNAPPSAIGLIPNNYGCVIGPTCSFLRS